MITIIYRAGRSYTVGIGADAVTFKKDTPILFDISEQSIKIARSVILVPGFWIEVNSQEEIKKIISSELEGFRGKISIISPKAIQEQQKKESESVLGEDKSQGPPISDIITTKDLPKRQPTQEEKTKNKSSAIGLGV